MRGSRGSDRARYEQDLSHYRSRVKANKGMLEGRPFLAVQLSFWLESFQFLITTLDSWEYEGNQEKYKETIHRMEKILKHMDKLMISVEDKNYHEEDTDPEI